jgi:plasmid stabilization system protein ParE
LSPVESVESNRPSLPFLDYPNRVSSHEKGEALMPQKAWSDKRERQYEHIKENLLDRGQNEDDAEEIAARTVNKERARQGEAEESSDLSREDISSGRRGGLRSGKGSAGRTFDQLYEEAKDLDIKGRSKMDKAQLRRAVNRRSGRKSR